MDVEFPSDQAGTRQDAADDARSEHDQAVVAVPGLAPNSKRKADDVDSDMEEDNDDENSGDMDPFHGPVQKRPRVMPPIEVILAASAALNPAGKSSFMLPESVMSPTTPRRQTGIRPLTIRHLPGELRLRIYDNLLFCWAPIKPLDPYIESHMKEKQLEHLRAHGYSINLPAGSLANLLLGAGSKSLAAEMQHFFYSNNLFHVTLAAHRTWLVQIGQHNSMAIRRMVFELTGKTRNVVAAMEEMHGIMRSVVPDLRELTFWLNYQATPLKRALPFLLSVREGHWGNTSERNLYKDFKNLREIQVELVDRRPDIERIEDAEQRNIILDLSRMMGRLPVKWKAVRTKGVGGERLRLRENAFEPWMCVTAGEIDFYGKRLSDDVMSYGWDDVVNGLEILKFEGSVPETVAVIKAELEGANTDRYYHYGNLLRELKLDSN